jgi:8-hydroxy-5-deazaflavin:NADPH oxidoreductase
MRIAFIGVGNVGSALANRLAKVSHEVVIGARDPNSDSVQAALALNTTLRALPIPEAVREAEVVFLATPYEANEKALASSGNFAGKVLVDCTNPVGRDLLMA